MRKTIIFITTLLCFKVMPVYAASFDCSKASTDVEKMICADEELSWLDDLLAQKYKKALQGAEDKEVLKKTQLSWLRERNYCEDNECIKEQLNSRINVLKIVLAEPLTYEAITKLPAGKDENGNEVFEQPADVDETDIKACQAITDNINEMEKYHIDWECGFPISSNSYLLSKPQLAEVTGKEKRRAQNIVSETARRTPGDDPLNNGGSIYGFSYNVDANDGDEKIYMGLYSHFKCTSDKNASRVELWFAESDGAPLEKRLGKGSEMNMINFDPVIFTSHLYFINYGNDSTKPKEFWITAIQPGKNSVTNRTVCTISPIN